MGEAPAARSGDPVPRRSVIAMVSDAVHPYHRGGKEVRYHELTRRLSELADIHIYTMHWWNGARERKDEAITLHAITGLLPLYVKNRRSMKQAILFAFACLRLLRCQFDILEADQIPFLQLPVLRLVATLKRKPFVVTWHEVWGSSYWREYLGKFGRFASFVESMTMRLPDHIIAASPQTAERLSVMLAGRCPVTVAPNGIDLDLVNEIVADTSATDVVIVGRLLAHKRVDMLLDAVALLRAGGAEVTCRIIGDGPERIALDAQARRLGIADLVDFRYDVREQKDVYSLIKAAKVAVFPSAREGFGIAVLEALACGLPVITTSAPDNVAQHLVARSSRGVVCEPTAAAIADSLRDVLADGDLSAGACGDAERADAWLAEYSWDAMADRVAEALLSATSSATVPLPPHSIPGQAEAPRPGP